MLETKTWLGLSPPQGKDSDDVHGVTEEKRKKRATVDKNRSVNCIISEIDPSVPL